MQTEGRKVMVFEDEDTHEKDVVVRIRNEDPNNNGGLAAIQKSADAFETLKNNG